MLLYLGFSLFIQLRIFFYIYKSFKSALPYINKIIFYHVYSLISIFLNYFLIISISNKNYNLFTFKSNIKGLVASLCIPLLFLILKLFLFIIFNIKRNYYI
jgi:hypothetical protein